MDLLPDPLEKYWTAITNEEDLSFLFGADSTDLRSIVVFVKIRYPGDSERGSTIEFACLACVPSPSFSSLFSKVLVYLDYRIVTLTSQSSSGQHREAALGISVALA